MILHDKVILVVGGDLRQVYLAQLLSKYNKVYTMGLEKADGLSDTDISASDAKLDGIVFDYISFPIPVGNDDETVNTPFSAKRIRVEDALSFASPGTYILGGKLSDSLIKKLKHRALSYTDLFNREELSIMNAIPTAEGAVQIAMEELPTTIFGTNSLVIGYGRVSKMLSKLLKAMGSNVTVSARSFEDLAWIQANGYLPANTNDLSTAIQEKQLIINTVPAAVLNEELLSKMPKSCLLIDLASKPGGVDFSTANRLGLKAIWALSLPGKVAPITAGKIIFDTMQNIESERRGNFE